jgi:chemotaxis protein MotB
MEMKKALEEHENEERWLITYADLITLLMVFFVVMYSMSRTDAEKFKQLASGLTQVFGKPAVSAVGVGGQPIVGNSILPNKSDGDARKGSRNQKADGDVRSRRMQTLKGDLDALMEKRGLSKSVTTKVDPKGPKLVMELADSLLFDPGSADLTPAAIELLKPVGEVLAAREYNIHVEGHTDNVPISGRYRNNFELSTARAVNVIMMLTETAGLAPQLFSASGYGEYRPLATNDTVEGRAKNRRVDFVIYDENALDAMLVGSSSGEQPPEDASLTQETAASGPAAASPDNAHTPDPASAPADAAAADSHGAAADATGTVPPPPDARAIAETSQTGPEHAVEAAPAPEPTHTPTLDAHVTTHAEGGEEASHSLSGVLALPKANQK